MGLSREFLVLWRQWRRVQPPVEKYRAGAKGARQYEIEANLDHLRTSVTSLGQGLMDGKAWNYKDRVNEELAELQLMRFLAEKLTDPQARDYVSYIDLTGDLLREIANSWDESTGSASAER